MGFDHSCSQRKTAANAWKRFMWCSVVGWRRAGPGLGKHGAAARSWAAACCFSLQWAGPVAGALVVQAMQSTLARERAAISCWAASRVQSLALRIGVTCSST